MLEVMVVAGYLVMVSVLPEVYAGSCPKLAGVGGGGGWFMVIVW